MAQTLVVGDIHGCADEFEALLERAALASGDRVIAVGDLFARGPRPERVLELFQRPTYEFTMGNHDRPILDALREGGRTKDLSSAQAQALERMRSQSDRLLDLLEGAPYAIHGATAVGTRSWVVVHAGIHPKRGVAGTKPREFLQIRQVEDMPGEPYWWDVYAGPELVLFGHTPREDVIQAFKQGRRVALGLDTGCVYGGDLTGYLPDSDRFVTVKARKAYFRKG
ncbi:MAG: metallophosphoesterase [Planctomycetes bacterium]|nr:metallophosphoesterase [Planctomycetota bacterium]